MSLSPGTRLGHYDDDVPPRASSPAWSQVWQATDTQLNRHSGPAAVKILPDAFAWLIRIASPGLTAV